MLRYDRQTKRGLVALYDIRPGNGAGRVSIQHRWLPCSRAWSACQDT